MAADCDNNAMRLADATDLKTMVGSLPAGRSIIAGNANLLTISVMWDDDGTGATGTGCNPADTDDLTCYTLVVTQ